MSDVVMDPPRANGQLSTQPRTDVVAPEAGSLDIVQILWRWKWLPILGSIVGAALGFLYFSRQPATYEAAALVQVVNSIPVPTNTQFFDPSYNKFSRVDESMVIKSQTILRKAVTDGRLTEQADFLGLQVDEVVGLLMDEDESTLVIEPADKDDQTTLISIAYVSEDAEVAARVVNAIVNAYDDYLKEEFANVGKEIGDLIEKANTALGDRLRDLTEKSVQFQKENTQIMWTGDGLSNPYAENYSNISKHLTEVRSKRIQVQSLAHQAKEAIAAGRSAEAVLNLLTSTTLRPEQYSNLEGRILEAGIVNDDNKLALPSSKLEQELLFQLRIKEQLYLEKFGPGHPSVAAVQEQISMTQLQIAKLRESEASLESEREQKLSEAKDQMNIRMRSVQDRLSSHLLALDEQVAVYQLEEANLEVQLLEQQRLSGELQGMLSDFRLLETEIEGVKTLLTAYSEKLQEVDLIPNAGQRTLKRLNTPSVGWYYGPNLPAYLLGGAAVGFILLSGVAVLMDLADRSYRNPSEISTDLGVNVLGHIPVMDMAKAKKSVPNVDVSVCSIHHSKGRVSEAYRSVRTGLYFSNRGRTLKVLQVTSPVPGDGKSTLSCNLAVTMAQSGRNVLLIDADLRRPRAGKIFGIEGEEGLSTVITKKCDIEDAIVQGPVPTLSILPGGKRPSNPAEILSSQRFRDLIEMLKEKYDIIVIDTPPLLAVSDPGAVAGIVDGVVMTMRLRRNVKPLAIRAKAILDAVGANLLGVVINGVSSEAGYGYNYDYNDYRYAYKYGSNYRTGYGYRYGYGNYRYGYSDQSDEKDLSLSPKD